MLDNARRGPDRALSNERYRDLAAGYDASCRWLDRIRRDAIDLLGPRAGETVYDIACGSGAMLPALAHEVGPGGAVIGIEQSPEMAAIALRRVEESGLANVRIVVSAVEQAPPDSAADALLLCYTHDVLQSDAAIARLLDLSRPGARIVIAGAKTLGWWAAPLNLWKLWRSRRYLTTYRGLREPWARLSAHIPDLHLSRTYMAGTSYLAVGHLLGRAPRKDLTGGST